ncbi:MAG: GNAT family N-acetyltransferase [Dehalococcoidia bacterium]
MALRIVQEDFSPTWDDWEALAAQTLRPSVFQTPLWHHVWWKELGGQAELRLISLREDETLVGIGPLMLHDDTLMFLGDTDLWDYHDFVIARDRDADFYPVLFEYLRQERWSRMDLRSLPEDSTSLRYLPELAKACGYRVEVTKEDVSPGVALPATWDDYLMGLTKKDRHELRRKLRRLEKQESYECYEVNGTSSLQGALEDFFILMRDSRQDKAIFLTPERERFFRHMADELARADLLKLFFMEVSGKRVASALCFDYGQTRFLYNSGYNPEYSSLSVGLLLKALCLRNAIGEGKTYFDFLRGDEPYKYDLGAKDMGLYQLVIQR